MNGRVAMSAAAAWQGLCSRAGYALHHPEVRRESARHPPPVVRRRRQAPLRRDRRGLRGHAGAGGRLPVLGRGEAQSVLKREGLRTRIIPLDAASIIVNVLPEAVDVEQVSYTDKSPTDFVVSDGSGWHLDLSHL